MIKFYTFTVLLFFSFKTISQDIVIDTLMLIEEIEISDSRPENSGICSSVLNIDKDLFELNSGYSVSQILSVSGALNIKTYGTSNLASVSFRGAGNSHTAVLWNGFNLEQATSGGSNIALIPVFFVDEIKLQLGGASSQAGSGAIGGIIRINNSSEFNKGFSTRITGNYGSFNSHSEGVELSMSKKKIFTRIRLLNTGSENNFKYLNTEKFVSQVQRQTNSRKYGKGFANDNGFKIGDNQIINTHFKYQNDFGQIPSTMQSENSKADQNDESYKISADYKYKKNDFGIKARAGLFINNILYRNPIDGLNIVSDIRSETQISEMEINFNLFNKLKINTGINNTYEKGITNYYKDIKERNRSSFFTSGKYQNKTKKILLASSIRAELLGNKFLPITWSSSGKIKIIENLHFRTLISKNYRLPSFNDLYWQDAYAKGNPDLKSETGFSKEAGFIFDKKIKTGEFYFTLTAYDNNISNLIILIPEENVYSPKNIRKVQARGLETGIKYSYSGKKYFFEFSTFASYTKSTNKETVSEELTGKQLVYIPVYKIGSLMKFRYKTYGIIFTKPFTGKRFYTADNNKNLPAFTLGNITTSKDFKFSTYKIKMAFSINNIWNTTYQLTEWYPMPGINFNINISFIIN